MQWDIFCQVIDNHGDAGVCWRLAAELAARGQGVRLWIDDPSPLDWMAPGGRPGVEVVRWQAQSGAMEARAPGEVVIEAFGCNPHEAYLDALARRARDAGRAPAWINLEYLSAEAWVERCHGLPSPVMSGPARGLVKRFFYPGFTPATGGLIREQALAARQAAFDPLAWRAARGLPLQGERLVSLFCYEPPALPALLRQLGQDPQPSRLLVTEGRARAAVEQALAACAGAPVPAITQLPLMPQPQLDQLLWACDLNFVRGEDSLVRALWAGRPFAWHIYPQDDGAHQAKLQAFLDWLQAPASLRALHQAWNGFDARLPSLDLPAWQACAQQARDDLLQGPELVSQRLAAAQAELDHPTPT